MSFYQNINLEVNFLSLFNVNRFYTSVQRWLLLIGFLVKLPVYGAHLWLPLAHVEAPVYGSIILAGVLLRLGELACSGFQNFFMPPHLWTEFGGKVIRDGASGRFKENHCLLFCFSYRIFRLTYLFSNKTHGEDFRS